VSGGSPDDKPQYKVYRSRRRLLDALRPAGSLEGLRERRRKGPREPRGPGAGRMRGPITPTRVLKWIALAVLGWVLLSLLLFMVSAQFQEGVSDRAEDSLSSTGSLLTGSTILVLGSDKRTTKKFGDPGAPRADSIMLVRASLGGVEKVSILRDTFAQIPGHTAQKINAAYAIGGAGLMVETIESFIGNGLKINHVVELDFEDFPKLIDSLGGIDVVAKRRICAPPFEEFTRTLRFRKGKNHVDGRRALGFARVRKNPCAPEEDDRARAERQQQVFKGIRDRVFSASTFFRLPWVSWKAPKTLRTDLRGPGLLALFADLATGTDENTPVLGFSCLGCGPGNSALVPEAAKKDAVQKLMGD
jgi:LCP family protein required for cell wall assembly